MSLLLRALTTPSAASPDLLEAQREVLESIIDGTPLEPILAALCRIVEQEGGGRVRASILLSDPEGLRLYTGAAPSLPADYCSAIDGIGIAPHVGTCCAAAARREMVVTSDIASDPAWQGLSHLPLALGLRAAWSLPILAADGSVLGTFGTYFLEARRPSQQEEHLVQVLARTAALAIERRRSDASLRDTALRHRFLAELAAATQPLSDPAAVMAETARRLAGHLGVDRCAYAEVEDERTFVITGDYAVGVPSIVGRWPVEAFGPACVRDMLEGRPYVVNDTDRHPAIGPDHLPAYRATNIRAVICVPLHKNGRFTAAMAVHQTAPRAWTVAEIELVAFVVARCWEALERARITRNLRDSEARYRTMVEASPECVKLIAADGTVLQINAAGLRMIAANREAVEGASIYEVIAPEYIEAYRRFNERVCAGEAAGLEYAVFDTQGRRVWLETRAVPLPAPGGGHMQLAMARDVTARRATERALADSRARLDYAVRLSGIGFWYCDLPFDKLDWDARVKEHFFLEPDAEVPIELFYERLHDEDREPTRSAIAAAIERRMLYDVVYRTVHPDTGAVKWIRALGGASYADDGTPVRFDGVTVDVSAQKRAESELGNLLQRAERQAQLLREQDQRKDEFLATLAHELRNPLAPIRTGLQVLEMRGLGAEQERIRQMMERQLSHLVRLVDDLLDVSRVTLGKLELRKEELDFRTVLHGAIETVRPLIEARGHQLALQLPPEPLPLLADATRLGQVIANLLNNAAKYTPPGGRIDVSAERDGRRLMVRVSDSGIGIPADMLEAIFGMFTQVSRSEEHLQGLGIGLTLVRRLVDMHGGTIVASSKGAGQGSTFTLELPLHDEPAQPAAEAAEPAPRARGLRILVVDDNVDAADSLAMLLGLNGHEPILAHTGTEALAAARRERPEAVLLDIGLPGMSGYEVAHALRQDGPDYRPFLIALTGWGTEEDRRRAQEAGFDRHLVKPVEMDALNAALDSLLS